MVYMCLIGLIFSQVDKKKACRLSSSSSLLSKTVSFSQQYHSNSDLFSDTLVIRTSRSIYKFLKSVYNLDSLLAAQVRY